MYDEDDDPSSPDPVVRLPAEYMALVAEPDPCPPGTLRIRLAGSHLLDVVPK